MTHDLILGGTRGIGRELALAWAAEGHQVSLIARTPPQADLMALSGLEAWTADAATEGLDAALDAVLRRGPLGSLVCCQRFRGDGDAWEGELAVSLSATRRVIERVRDAFDSQGPRSIVLVGSVVGRSVAGEQPVGYHVAKAGLAQMARYYAVKLGGRGIRVNCVAPAVFIKAESRAYYQEHPELEARFARVTPLGRMGTAAEVAGAIALLCSPGAAFITGQELVVDGGLSLLAQASLAQSL